MFDPNGKRMIPLALSGMLLGLLGIVFLSSMQIVSAQGPAPNTACPGGPTIDGITLDECVNENFTVGGDNVGITVWYTKNPVTATRTIGGNPVIFEHWIDTDAQAQNVATWGRQAWEAFHAIYGRHPWNCGLHINMRMEDGTTWWGIARWTSSDCHIAIDSPMIRTNNAADGAQTVYHEFQHFVQRSYDSGCSGATRPGYPGNSDWVEGYADLASDAVSAVVDAWLYGGWVAGYDPLTSFYDKGYDDVFPKYFMEQLGSQWTPAEPRHHMDTVREHYEECDVQDSLYVESTLVPDLSSGRWTWQELFMNFFAANWAKDWADPVTQPELVYTDDDANPYGQISLAQNVALSTGSQSWTSQVTPDDWAGRYYQVRPQPGCDYVTVDVDGNSGDRLGINLMAADSLAPTSVSRSAWIGEDFSRTFGGAGVHDRVAASINAFANTGGYDVSFTCVSPSLDLLEPKPRHNHVLVGDPTSPIAFLARFKVTSGGTPVRGLPVTSFTGDAEGDAVTFVAGTFQEVGEEYWAVLAPPVKVAGTTFIDLQLCLDGTICDTHTDALLYVDPGNTDFALVFDASGSMDKEDVAGEGMRYVNAHKAGHVLADLLRTGDRIMVTDFSAFDQPASPGDSCTPDCALDLKTRLTRRDVVAGTITQVKGAIDQTDARDWTPIGAALRDAKNQLQAAPYSLNPKVIVLLSDGEENVNPMYAGVRTELIDSGVVIDTVGFGIAGETGEATLAQIAADTNGAFRFVPSKQGSLATHNAAQVAQLKSLGATDQQIEDMTNAWLPGPLGLNEVYDYFETKNQGAARLLHASFVNAEDTVGEERSTYVDASVNRLRFVVAGKRETEGYGCAHVYRHVSLLQPGGNPGYDWIEVSPNSALAPSGWDVRNGLFDDVVIIPNPAPGWWKIRAGYRYTGPCLEDGDSSEVEAPAAGYDFMMSGSAQSEFHLEGRFLAPIVDNQGDPGDVVPIVGTLLSRSGTVPGAAYFVPNTIWCTLERPDGTLRLFWLYDDGAHMDGEALDGIYGAYYGPTELGGVYSVRLQAFWDDPLNPGHPLSREWRGAFHISDPADDDGDGDGLPDGWEIRHGLDTSADDSWKDPDADGLTNKMELEHGTNPNDPDTDHGGEQDGSEVRTFDNPLEPVDDDVPELGHVSVTPGNGTVHVHWPRPGDCQNMRVYVADNPEGVRRTPYDMGDSGSFSIPVLNNGQTYYLTFVCLDNCADPDPPFDNCEESAPVGPIEVTPNEDPDPPSGVIMINGGALETRHRQVALSLSAADTPLEGPASPSAGALKGPLTDLNVETGVQEMILSNDPSFAGASWQPYVREIPWTLARGIAGRYVVFAKFRDGAQNESNIVQDDIYLDIRLQYLPVILKNR